MSRCPTTLLAAIAVTVLGWHLVASESGRNAGERFHVLTDEIESRITDRLQSAEEILLGAAGLFAASQSVERDEWREYVARLRLEKNFPGIQGVAYALRIQPSEKDAHVEQVRSAGFPDYRIKPEGVRDEYNAIVYIEPFSGRNLRAFGYDMLTEPVRGAAMMAARDTGETTISGKVTLQQETETGVQAGFVMYPPVYRNGAAVATVEQRGAALSGYVSVPFRVNDLLASTLDRELLFATLQIFDGESPVDDALLYDSELVHGRARQHGIPIFTSQTMLDIENRRWTLRFTSLPAFEKTIDRQKAQVVMIAGIVISLLLFILVRSLAVTRERALALAKDMTSSVLESEAKFRSLAESANEAIVISKGEGKIVSWNRGAQAIFGYTAREIVDDDLTRIMPERYREPHRRGMERMRIAGEGRLLGKTIELAGLRKDGSEFPLELSLAAWETHEGRFYSGVIRDITGRKALETELAQRNELVNAVLENVESGIVVCDAEGALTLFNRATREFHNLPQEPLPASRWAEHYDLYHADGSPMQSADIPLFKALQDQPVRDQELMIVPKHGGKKRVLLASGQALFGHGGEKLGAVVVMHDITERRQKEQAISAALREKETLLKEVYHRVKNNLQVITSLFNLQVRTLPAGEARNALQESANRVRAMALVHEKLYQSGDLSSIDLKSYIGDLCHRLGAAAGAKEQGIDIVSVVEAVDVGIESAVPLGLILNELVTNSLKHAFPDGRKGILSVVLERFDDGTALLTVADDGVGMANDSAPDAAAALGVKLVETLSRQLDGDLTFESAGGTRARLRFPVPDLRPNPPQQVGRG
ncbi:MAG: CHASE domain-containing protein [Burkholderiales bacterium]